MPYADPEAKKANDREYYLRNREKRMAYMKQWQDENRERVRAYKRAWADNNPEYAHEWYMANRDESLEQAKANARRRLEADPERFRAQARNRVAKRRAKQREAYVEHVDPLIVWERDEGICGCCGQPADPDNWHLDHVIPIVRGGEHSYANVQVTHPLCNWSKGAS